MQSRKRADVLPHLWSKRDKWTVTWKQNTWVFIATEVEMLSNMKYLEEFLDKTDPDGKHRTFSVTREPG